MQKLKTAQKSKAAVAFARHVGCAVDRLLTVLPILTGYRLPLRCHADVNAIKRSAGHLTIHERENQVSRKPLDVLAAQRGHQKATEA